MGSFLGNFVSILAEVLVMAIIVRALLSWFMPGDGNATGTPAGVGPLVAGDTVEVHVAGVGVLRNPVHAPKA